MLRLIPHSNLKARVKSRAFLHGLVLLTLVLLGGRAHSDDKLGEFSLSSYFLEPYVYYAERRSGSVHPGPSYVEFTWAQNNGLSAVFRVGTSRLIGKPIRYGPELPDTNEKIQFVEAYGQADTSLGRIRTGIVPIPFGLEGGDSEMRLRFPRSLLFSRGMIGLRDHGFAYHIANEGFFSDWAIHNGEGGPDLDNQIWFTARWGYQAGQYLVGFAAQTGRTSPASTNVGGTASSSIAGLDVTRPSKVRVVDLFARLGDRRFGVELEAVAGDTIQGDDVTKMRALRADVDWQFYDEYALLARYDMLRGNGYLSGKDVAEFSLGVAWRNKYETSVVTLLAKKTVDQAVPNSVSGLLSWRLTPVAIGRLSPL